MNRKRWFVGLSLVVILLMVAGIALAATTLTYSAAPGLPIPDSPGADIPGALVWSTIVVADTGMIQDLNVAVNITHTFNNDLIVTLTHVDTGTTVTLANRVGGSGNNIVATLDDSASAALPGGSTPPITGTFRPSQALAAFNGEDIQGTWQMTVQDFFIGDIGTFNTWGMKATVGPFPVVQPTTAAEPRWIGWEPGDGRLNPDPAAPLAIYCDTDSAYAYFPGYLEFDFPLSEIGDAPALLTEGVSGARLYRLATGELQVNFAHANEEYVFTFDACPATITKTHVYDATTGALLSEFTRRP